MNILLFRMYTLLFESTGGPGIGEKYTWIDSLISVNELKLFFVFQKMFLKFYIKKHIINDNKKYKFI